MSLAPVRSDGSTRINPEQRQATVKNLGTSPVLYGTELNVSSSKKTGELAQNKSVTISLPTYFIVEPPTRVGTNLLGVREQTLEVIAGRTPVEEAGYYAKARDLNVEEFGVKNDGATDDTVALQEAVNAAKEARAIIPPGGGCVVSAGIKVPLSTVLAGTNRRTCSIIAKGTNKAAGEFSILELGSGDIAVENLWFRCAEAQTTKGAAFDFSKGYVTNCQINGCQVGSNFFNGFNIVGEGEISNIFIRDLLFEEFTGGVKSIGNAGFAIGSPTVTGKRVIDVRLINVKGHADKQADMPAWFKIANTDSMTLTNCGFQNGLTGVIIGEGDVTAQGTTNFTAEGVWVDGGPEGMGKGWGFNSCFAFDLQECHAQGCNPGVYVNGNANGNVTGGKYYHNNGSGFWITAAAKANSAFGITGATIVQNNFAGGTEPSEQCGIFMEEKASGLTVVGCTLGNLENMGTSNQKYGILLGKKSENIGIYGNRFHKNVTEPINKKGEEVNINGKAAPTFAELETVNFKS